MFFIIPVGSEEGVRRLPYVTIGLIALNAIIWVITGLTLNSQVAELERLNERLLEIESHYAYELITEDPALLNETDYNKIRERIYAGDVIPVGTEDYRQWKTIYEKYKKNHENLVFNQLGVTPARFNFLKLFSSLFVHANFFHILFNMLFLWLVGCNIEDDWSWKVFLGLYIISGLVAGIFHCIAFPHSQVPLIGASGAIAGVMGAFMVRHFKTKIRFAYFLFIFIRPYFGTFSVYAGIALPIWFVQQIFGASWGGESGTAYWAHIGGFIFGAAIGASFKYFGIEKKYIEPMVEDSFEKLPLSPRMKEAHALLDAGDVEAAMPLVLRVISEESQNVDARLVAARIFRQKDEMKNATYMYDKALEVALRTGNADLVIGLRDELQEYGLLRDISEKNLYGLAVFLEQIGRYEEAVRIYGIYIEIHRASPVRPKAIYRVHLLFKNKLKDVQMAQNALAYLHGEYPGWMRA